MFNIIGKANKNSASKLKPKISDENTFNGTDGLQN